MGSFPDLYPLTVLQIGDIKSYLSRAFLYFAPISHKFFILVDNQSWQRNKHLKSTHIWEFIVTKYRVSPFRNSRTLLRSPSLGKRYDFLASSNDERKNLFKWWSGIKTTSWTEKVPFSMIELCEALHGFIVFEVAWKDVHGINYFNVLQQTDSSLALEVKSMRKWEFYGIDQALSCISSWFSGTTSETQTLKDNLILLHAEVSSHSSWGITLSSKELLFNGASQIDILSDGVFFDVRECPLNLDDKIILDYALEEHLHENYKHIESMGYKDILLLLQFNDRDLPFQLQQIITSDMRLLKFLESGLPSWVIFLQSYPLFCGVYCPWMRPLARAFYILISLITVIIGFYDLYKNVPLLKATVSHLCGPLFRWVEAWEMINRIRYLGTMLFLQNSEKAFKWLLTIMQVLKPLVSLLTKPLMAPLEEAIEVISPIWGFLAEIGLHFYDTAWVVMESLCSMIVDLSEVLLSPFKLLYSYTLTSVTLVFPIFSCMWELLLFPTRIGLLFANYMASLLCDIYDSLEWVLLMPARSIGQLRHFVQVKPSSHEISFWHSLWKDLFSKVFWSVRSIVRVLVSFFTSCNRHKLSILNHLRAVLWRLCHLLRLAPRGCPCQNTPQVANQQAEVKCRECNRCK